MNRMSVVSSFKCLMCYLMTVGQLTTSQVNPPYHTDTSGSPGPTTSAPSVNVTNSVSQEMISTNAWLSTVKRATGMPRNVSNASVNRVTVTERWSATTLPRVRQWSQNTDTGMEAETPDPGAAAPLPSTVPLNTTKGVSEDMEPTRFLTSPTPTNPTSLTIHLTSSTSQPTLQTLLTSHPTHLMFPSNQWTSSTSHPTHLTFPSPHITTPTSHPAHLTFPKIHPTSPTSHPTHLTFSNTHLTSPGPAAVDWLSTYHIPNVSVRSCPEHCQCFAESVFDAYAKAYFQLMVSKPEVYQSVGSPAFRDFRVKLLAPYLASKMGKTNFIQVTKTNKAYVKCTLDEMEWVVDESFESHFSELDLTRTLFNLTLHCASGDTTVIWASNNVTLETLTVDGCSHIVLSDRIKTTSVFSKLSIKNSSQHWLDDFEFDNNTKLLVSLDIRGTQFTHLPGIFNRDVPLHLNTLRLQNVSLRRLDCSVMSNFIDISTLDLSQNLLTKIEDCFLPASIEILNVSYNNINDLSPLEFPRFVRGFNVTLIDLCGNQISALRPFTKLNVASLSLCKNFITMIEQFTFLQLSDLYVLDLSWNKISHIEPGAFRFLYDLQFLDLSHNHLVSLGPETSPGVACNIDISYNRFHYPAFSSRNFETIAALGITAHNNPYYCDCDLPKLQAFLAQGQNKDLYKRMRESLNVSFIFNRTYPEKLFSVDELTCVHPESLRGERMVDVVFNGSCPVVDKCPVDCDCSNKQGFVFVDCASRNLTFLPDVMPNGLLHLDFRQNNISTLSARDYLSRTQVLNLSKNALAEISSGVFDHLTSIHFADLTHNELQTLPGDLQQVSFSNAPGILLSENPWRCDCGTLWMSEWLREHTNVTDAKEARCHIPLQFRGKPVITVTSDDLTCEITSYYPLAITFGLLGLVVLVCIPILYHFRLETRVLLHAKFHIRPFDGRVKNPEDNVYDTFVSYSNQDSAWVTETLLPRLENHKPPFKVCIHQRDFVIGEAISDNITEAISTSHATLMVVSEHFAESEWCLFEFQRAHHEMLQDGRRRLIAVLVGDVDVNGLPMDLKTYLKTNTYLSIEDRWFWPKLLYALPDPPSRAERDEFYMEVYASEAAMHA